VEASLRNVQTAASDNIAVRSMTQHDTALCGRSFTVFEVADRSVDDWPKTSWNERRYSVITAVCAASEQ